MTFCEICQNPKGVLDTGIPKYYRDKAVNLGGTLNKLDELHKS